MEYQIEYDAHVDCWNVYSDNTVLVSVLTEQDALAYVARNRALIASWEANEGAAAQRYLRHRDD